MAHYLIGDIHGSFNDFQYLLAKIGFNFSKDTLWLTGDVMNRGLKTLETIIFIKKHEDVIKIVLGNHELYFLAVALGYLSPKKNDTFDETLKSKNLVKIIDWLRKQPLLIKNDKFILVHAGLLPEWDANMASSFANEVEDAVKGKDYQHVFKGMYGNKPNMYTNELKGMDKLRLIMNVMTRIRVITFKNELNFKYKGELDKIPKNLQAWFKAKDKKFATHTVLFGHWAALGVYMQDNVICADTGAVWGNYLTAINLETFEVINSADKLLKY